MGIALYFGHQGCKFQTVVPSHCLLVALEQEIVYTDCAMQNGTRINDVIQREMSNETLYCSYSITLDEDYTVG